MSYSQSLKQAPDLSVSQWFNTKEPITLENLRGKVVVIEAFQMLCPGCVQHGLPLAQRIREHFPAEKVAVLGLHTVFEHHNAMTPISLKAFIHEYRLDFLIGVDEAGINVIPKTMEAYQLRGTPSLIIIGQEGHLLANYFGHISDMQVASEITRLIYRQNVSQTSTTQDDRKSGCDESGCTI